MTKLSRRGLFKLAVGTGVVAVVGKPLADAQTYRKTWQTRASVTVPAKFIPEVWPDLQPEVWPDR